MSQFATPEIVALETIRELDAQRATGFCDELEIITHAIRQRDEWWRQEIAVRENDIAMLKQVYQSQKKRGAPTHEEIEKMKRDRNNGMSFLEIAKKYGFKSKSAAFRHCGGDK